MDKALIIWNIRRHWRALSAKQHRRWCATIPCCKFGSGNACTHEVFGIKPKYTMLKLGKNLDLASFPGGYRQPSSQNWSSAVSDHLSVKVRMVSGMAESVSHILSQQHALTLFACNQLQWLAIDISGVWTKAISFNPIYRKQYHCRSTWIAEIDSRRFLLRLQDLGPQYEQSWTARHLLRGPSRSILKLRLEHQFAEQPGNI